MGGQVLEGIPLPQALLARLFPLLAASRTPIRYIAPAGLCLAVAVAQGWSILRRRQGFAEERRPRPLELLVAGLVLFESLSAPMTMTTVPIPAVYGAIGNGPGTAALIHLPEMTARDDLLYQTIHGQRLVANVGSAIPLRSHRGPEPFSSGEWKALTRNLNVPGWTASLNAAQREQTDQVLRGFLERYGIRWVVALRTHEVLLPDASGFQELPAEDSASYQALIGNLRLLGPIREQEIGGATLFEFVEQGHS
jgi:hypothetical protein